MVEYLNNIEDSWKIPLATITGALIAFFGAMTTLLITSRYSKLNYNFLVQKDRYEKQKSYNRVLGSFLKVYHSFLKHNLLFSENKQKFIPDDQLISFAQKLDNLTRDIEAFKKTVNEEAEILPEITLNLHSIIDLLDRFEIANTEIPNDVNVDDTENSKLVILRAQAFAVNEILNDAFHDLINTIAIKAEVSEEFLNNLRDYNSDSYEEKSLDQQEEIYKRFIESYERQTGKKFPLDDFK